MTVLKQLIYFFGLTFTFSWLPWGLAVLESRDQIQIQAPIFVLMILGGLGPMLAAILIVGKIDAREGIIGLFRQLVKWKTGLFWYAIVVLLFGLRVTPLVYNITIGQPIDWISLLDQLSVLPITFVFVATLGGGVDEEMGWRGFALPKLQSKMPPLAASLLLGVIWSCWHLPLWFIPGTAQAEMAFPLYVLSTTALSIIISWIYNGSGNSLLLAVLAHAASNSGDNLRIVAAGLPTGEANNNLDLWVAMTFSAWAAFICISTRGTLGVRKY